MLAGTARHGTADDIREGRFPPAEFERLARLLETKRFDALADRYEDPDLRDGAWSVLEVDRGSGGTKQVFTREDAGPDALKEIEAAVVALADRIVYAPER